MLNSMRVMETLRVIVLQMSTQKQCHEFIVAATSGREAAAANELAVSANECPSESHQLCRAYRRAPCGRRRPLLFVIFARAIFRIFPNNLQWCFALAPLFKNVQNENRLTGTHGPISYVKYIRVDCLTR